MDNGNIRRADDDTVKRGDVIEAMYQWLKRPSNDEKWMELYSVILNIPTSSTN